MTLRFGVLGAAKIAPTALVLPAGQNDDVEVVAIAARDRRRAEAFATEHGIATVLDDYAAVIDHPDVDAVFVPLPMHLHADWTIRALDAGKHVLCEKPFAANADEASAMVEAAERNDRRLVEAFHWRYHPLATRMKAIVRSGELGEVESIHGRFMIGIDDRSDIRWQWACAGGALMDLGCYPVHWARFLGNGEPSVTSAAAVVDVEKIDSRMVASLTFPDGVDAKIECSMIDGDAVAIDLVVVGSEATMTVVNPLAPHHGHSIVIDRAGDERTETATGRSTYDHQLTAFVSHVRNGDPVPTGGDDAIANMAVIDAIYDAAGLPRRGT